MRVIHFLNTNTMFWIFPLFCALEVFIPGGQCMLIIQKWDFLLTGRRMAGKGEVIKEKLQGGTLISLQVYQCPHNFGKVFVYPRSVYTHFNTLIGALFAHLFILQVFTKHLQHAGCLYNKYGRYSSEQNKWNSLILWTLPSMDQVGCTGCEICDWCCSQSCPSLLESEQGSVLSTPKKCMPSSLTNSYGATTVS